MKHIIMALALTAFGYTGAIAKENCCKCPAKARHHIVKKTKHRLASPAVLPSSAVANTAVSCRALPYEVCRIMPDRKTVRCYKTTDLENLTPLNNTVTWYGPTGEMPHNALKTNMQTVVITGAKQPDGCKRNFDKKTTTCTLTDILFLTRDANGNYSYTDYNYSYSYH